MEQKALALRGVWAGMLARCNNPAHQAYRWYGAKGIGVEFGSLAEFRQWALVSGYERGLWLDRIDRTKGYSAENCRWITPTEQQRNRSSNVIVAAFGETKALPYWAEDTRCAVSYDTLRQRIRAGWEAERAITERPASERGYCARGHPWNDANTAYQKGGYRKCRACFNEARRAWRASVRAQGGRAG